MIPAAAAVFAARRAITEHDGAVATVGRINPIPGGTNVIASAVQLWLDVRHESGTVTAAIVDSIVARGPGRGVGGGLHRDGATRVDGGPGRPSTRDSAFNCPNCLPRR